MKLKAILASLWLAAAACATPAQGAGDAYRWSIRYMLVNGTSDTELFFATQEIANYASLRTPEMHELLAEVLAHLREHELPAQEAALNIVRILAASPDAGRYQTLIASQKKFLTAKGSTPLLTRYLKAHRKPQGEQFVPGKIDLVKLRKQFIDAALAVQPTAAQVTALQALPPGSTMDELFASVGTPTQVLPRDTRAAMQYAHLDVRQIVFYYRGVGRISYGFERNAWKPLVVDIDPLAFEDQMPYRRDAAAHGMPDDARLLMIQLLSGRPYAIRISAMAVYRLEEAPGEYLDTAAELLLSTHAQATDEMAVDAYSWLCNALTHHDERRFAAVLARVAREANDPKLERYASKVRKTLRPEAARAARAAGKRPAYVPGSVSLEETRARYPSLYERL